MWLFISIIISLLFSSSVKAEVIEFPEEELAQESVLPVFDRIEVVKSRRVAVEERFEVGGGIGFNLTEALYDNKNFNVNLTYNFSNLHAVNFIFVSPFNGLSNMGQDLADGKGLSGGRFDASLAPYPERYMLLNYQLTAYYGKISISKDYVMNIVLYGLAGLTQVAFSDSTSIGAVAGIGQKFYLTQNFGLRFDLLGTTYSGPDPTTAANLNPTLITSQVSSTSLKETIYFRTFFNFGLVYIF